MSELHKPAPLKMPAPDKHKKTVKNPFSWYAPRFWHGMRAGTWFGYLRRNRFAVSPSRIPMVLAISAASLLNSAMAALDCLLYARRVRAVKLQRAPLFILGHWRSGTTFLHELMIRDPQHNSPTTYQCYTPHHFLVTASWVKPLTAWSLPRRRPMDNMATGWQRPQEDEFALENLGVPTPYVAMMYPNHGPVYPEYLTLQELSTEQRQRWEHQLRRFFHRIAFRDPRRLIVKSPTHTARVATLRQMYPDAQFVHLTRDPIELYASTVQLWKSLNDVQAIQLPKDQSWVEPYVLDTFDRMYAAFAQDRQTLSPNQLVEVRYEHLIEDPLGELRRVYDQLDLGQFSTFESAATLYLEQVKNYRPNQHQIDDATRAKLEQRWRWYFETYGYSAGVSAGSVAT